MNVLFKKAEEIGSKVFGVGNAPTPNDQPPLVTGVAEVELSYEQQRYKLHLDVSATAAAFCTQVYLATGVIPSRQKIVGFKTSGGQAHPTPLLPDADMRKLGIRPAMKLMLFQLPIGHELEPYYLTNHVVDRVASKCMVLQQRVDAIEAILLVQRLDGSSPEEMATASKLQKLCILYDDNGLKLLLKIDEIDGDENTKAARKALVRRVNGELDRLERLKKRLQPMVASSDTAGAAGGQDQAGGSAAAGRPASTAPAAAGIAPNSRLETPRPDFVPEDWNGAGGPPSAAPVRQLS